MVDMKELQKSFYECFRNLRAAEFIGSDFRTKLAEESFTYAIRKAEENHHKAMKEMESITAQLNALNDDMAFIKRWVQRVHDKETTLEEFYGVLRYHTPLKPIEVALNQQEEKI